jgi:hypothetical protein
MQPPEHLTGGAEAYFMLIANEMVSAGVEMRPADAILVEGLAAQLELLRRAGLGIRAGEAPEIHEAVHAKALSLARDFARDLGLPEAALRRLMREQ